MNWWDVKGKQIRVRPGGDSEADTKHDLIIHNNTFIFLNKIDNELHNQKHQNKLFNF